MCFYSFYLPIFLSHDCLWYLNTPPFTDPCTPDILYLVLGLDHRDPKDPALSLPPSHSIAPCIGTYLLDGVLLCHVGVRTNGGWVPNYSRVGRVELRGKVMWVQHLAEAEDALFLDWTGRVIKLMDQSADFSGCGPGPLMAVFCCLTVSCPNLGSPWGLEAWCFCTK